MKINGVADIEIMYMAENETNDIRGLNTEIEINQSIEIPREYSEIIEYVVHSIVIEKGGTFVVLDRVIYGGYLLKHRTVYFDDFGKKVFLSREEAEAELEKRRKEVKNE